MNLDELRRALELIPADNPINKARRRELIKAINAVQGEPK